MFLLDVIGKLEKYKINYAIVGGFAVALHGATRGTVDIDLVIEIEKRAFVQVEKALHEFGLQSRLPVTSEEVFNFREEYIRNKNLIAWTFINPDRPIDIVDIIITEDLNDIKTTTKKIQGKKVKIASIDDLIAMKKKSNRPQDKLDVKALKSLQ